MKKKTKKTNISIPLLAHYYIKADENSPIVLSISTYALHVYRPIYICITVLLIHVLCVCCVIPSFLNGRLPAGKKKERRRGRTNCETLTQSAGKQGKPLLYVQIHHQL